MSASDVIARLRELRAKATPAPWSAKKEAFDDDEWERQYVYHAIPNGEMPVAFPLGGTREDANAAAIVAAMNSLESLLECAEALAQITPEFEELFSHCEDDTDPDYQNDLALSRKARAALAALAKEVGE